MCKECAIQYTNELIARRNKPKETPGLKKCCVCKLIKPIDCFYTNNRAKDGHSSKCKDCQRDYNVDYCQKNQFPLLDISSKVCKGCGQEKPIADFGRDKYRKDGHVDYCQECRAEQRLQRKLKYPNFSMYQNKRLKYGLSEEQFESMLKEQEGKCAICGNPEFKRNGKGEINSLSVDHDHTTLKNRQLLCNLCNAAIGMLRDDPEIAQRAADYLRRHKQSVCNVQSTPEPALDSHTISEYLVP